MTIYPLDKAFADAWQGLIGKTVAAVEARDSGTPVHLVEIAFTDGTLVEIMGEHDEGFLLNRLKKK